ncbi:MAG TPA: DUF222 domain-containing protein, partial [Actinotalea sp.]
MTAAATESPVRQLSPTVSLIGTALRDLQAVVGERSAGHADTAVLIRHLDRAIGALTAARADLLVAERQGGAWRSSGDPTFEAWRGRSARVGQRAASLQVRQASTLASLPRMRAAAITGAVTPEHVDVVARVSVAASPAVQRALTSESGQSELLAMARRQDAGTFARSAMRWAARHDLVAAEHSHQSRRASRFLHVVDTPAGTRLTGLLDEMAGHRLRLALEAVTARPAADDDRSAEQRRADALDVLAEKVLALPETSSGAAVRPHVSLHMSDATWAALRAHHVSGGTPATAGDAGRTLVADPVTLDDGTPVPLSEVARALCDCELTRVVVGADGVPLDVGRSQRTYTGAQRRAVLARDRSCGWPGCAAQARWCDVHHIRWWDRDRGSTSVENGVL